MGDYIGNQPIPTVKGPRNYIQLSDGSQDLMYSSNLYLTSNNFINNHIGGSGIAPQMAYFTGPETISSTADAEVVGNQILLSSGNASNPTLSFQEDINTGIYHIAADNLGISTNANLSVSVATSNTEIIGINSEDGSNDILKVLYSKSAALVINDGPSIQFELEATGISAAAKKQLNQIRCICTDISNWGTDGPVCATAFTDTETSGGSQTNTERLRIQPGDGPHVVVDGNTVLGWSALDEKNTMLHYAGKQTQILQFSDVNDVQTAVQQPGIAICDSSESVTSKPIEVSEKERGRWLITPPFNAARDGSNLLCSGSYGMIGNTVLGSGPVTVTEIQVPLAPPGVGWSNVACHGTQLIITKLALTKEGLTIQDNFVSGGNIFIGRSSPWTSMFSLGSYKIPAADSATISFIYSMATGGGVSGYGWHCTGFHTNVG